MEKSDAVRVAEIMKEGRLEERKLIENGLSERQKTTFKHEFEITKLRLSK